MRVEERPLDEATQREFEVLLNLLDLGIIQRDDWERLKAIVVLATMEAGDSESGRRGYWRALAQWRTSLCYDGQD